MDTCFCPLEEGGVIYFPGAFDAYALNAIQGIVGEDGLIPVRMNPAPRSEFSIIILLLCFNLKFSQVGEFFEHLTRN